MHFTWSLHLFSMCLILKISIDQYSNLFPTDIFFKKDRYNKIVSGVLGEIIKG